MEELLRELQNIVDKLEPISKEMENRKIKEPIDKLSNAAEEIGKSWSNSFCGYHSRVYYNNFTEVPPGAHFSLEWGFIPSISGGTTGDWKEYRFGYVIKLIEKKAGNPELSYFENKSKEAKDLFNEYRDDLISILRVVAKNGTDDFLEEQIKIISEYKIFTMEDFARHTFPSGDIMTRDTNAIQQGLQAPPHLNVVSNLFALSMPIQLCKSLFEDTKRVIKHIRRLSMTKEKKGGIDGKTVFLGHGHSFDWKDLKDFLKDRLKLKCEEFNSEPTAGKTTKERLEEMLNNACFAFIVMTAEDEQKDGTIRARENVVHEIGLFQGKLGFARAIVLLENGCKEFSNIEGLGQIRFPKGDLSSKFEEIRKVLEREDIISK